MASSLFAVLPVGAACMFAIGTIAIGTRAPAHPSQSAWIVPAALSAALFAWSVWTIALEGPLGFWRNHTANAWGNQVWFDLLLGVAAAYGLVVPGARRLGMHPLLWLIAIACTGSIGLLAMISRYLYLDTRGAHE